MTVCTASSMHLLTKIPRIHSLLKDIHSEQDVENESQSLPILIDATIFTILILRKTMRRSVCILVSIL